MFSGRKEFLAVLGVFWSAVATMATVAGVIIAYFNYQETESYLPKCDKESEVCLNAYDYMSVGRGDEIYLTVPKDVQKVHSVYFINRRQERLKAYFQPKGKLLLVQVPDNALKGKVLVRFNDGEEYRSRLPITVVRKDGPIVSEITKDSSSMKIRGHYLKRKHGKTRVLYLKNDRFIEGYNDVSLSTSGGTSLLDQMIELDLTNSIREAEFLLVLTSEGEAKQSLPKTHTFENGKTLQRSIVSTEASEMGIQNREDRFVLYKRPAIESRGSFSFVKTAYAQHLCQSDSHDRHANVWLEYSVVEFNFFKKAISKNDHEIAVFVRQAGKSTRRIVGVVYYLHPTFSNSVIRRTDSSDNYRLVLGVWGQFTIRAIVEFDTGPPLELSKFLSFTCDDN